MSRKSLCRARNLGLWGGFVLSLSGCGSRDVTPPITGYDAGTDAGLIARDAGLGDGGSRDGGGIDSSLLAADAALDAEALADAGPPSDVPVVCPTPPPGRHPGACSEESTDSEGNVTYTTFYWIDGKLYGISINDPIGGYTDISYYYDDGDERITSAIETPPDGNAFEYFYYYDSADRLIRKDKAPAGAEPIERTTYVYDAAGRLTEENIDLDVDGTNDRGWKYDYDACGRRRRDELDRSLDGTVELRRSYSYNDRGFLVTVEENGMAAGFVDQVFMHSYDTDGNRLRTVSDRPGSPEVVYNYDCFDS